MEAITIKTHHMNYGISQYIYANDLSWNLGNCVKYITRNKEDKVEDLLKAKHYIDLELEMVYGCNPEGIREENK